MSFIAWFSELSKEDVPLAGGKGANLGEMYNAKLPIPPGFAVTSEAFKAFIENTGLKEQIFSLLKNLDEEDNAKLQEVSKKIKELILKTLMPQNIASAITEAYDNLDIDEEVLKRAGSEALSIVKGGREPPLVAVRSSATAEDLPEASFAGQQETFLNIRGNNPLLIAVQKCWASLYTARAIYYRVKNNFPHEKVLIAVIVQKMVNSDKAGVMFSINPATNNESEILIEGAFGLGEVVVSGAITPDEYLIDKETEEVKNINIGDKDYMLTLDHSFGKTVKRSLPPDKRKEQVLNDHEIAVLTQLTKRIEHHYGKAQDMEWAIEGSKIYITQSRPVTTLKKRESKEETKETKTDKEPIVTGIPASPGVGIGPVKIVHNADELSKIEKGDVLVAEMTNPDYVSAMEKSVAIVTDRGGSTCHASIVGREMGIPVIVGTKNATEVLKEGQVITVDATAGKVYEGELQIAHKEEKEQQFAPLDLETATEVKVIVDLPQFAHKAAETGADGVGLLRVEMMIVRGKVHPAYMLRTGRTEELVEQLVQGISEIAKAFEGKPVWYRTSDIRTDEYRELEGGDEEPKEDNPMMGYHGIRRGMMEKDLLRAEFEAIKKVHDMGLTNVGVMLSLVTHLDQVSESKKILREVGLEPQENIDFGIMVETPAAVQIIKEICEEGIDFVSFGTNDLTQFTLALDRNNENVANLYDEMHPAVLRQIKYVIDVCREYNVETSICGQAGSNPEMAEFLVRAGIDSISANADAVHKIRNIVAKVEKKILLDVARKDMQDRNC
ncbi:MAG: phosphoenolpyruvate synthase [archaeon]